MPWTFENEHPFGSALTVRKHRLHNGLGVLLVEDDAAPIFTLQTWYRVGSRCERPGRTGMAHLFEHLMFNRTQKREVGQFDREIEACGGDSNAATWVDWTYYRDSLPSDRLDLALDLESDRMANLVLEDEQLEAERDVVINERIQRVDDDIDGFLDEQLMKLAFEKHPYHWPTIGWMRDIRAIDRTSVLDFYRTYYAPNNATLVLVGDIEEGAALDAIERAYGELSAADIPDETAATEPAQTGERRAVFSKPVTGDRLSIGFKAPPQSHPDWLVLEVVSDLLTGGPSARLYRRLVVEQEAAVSIYSGVLPFRDPSLFYISAAMNRDHLAADGEATVNAELDRLRSDLVADDELAKAKNSVETDFWNPLTTVDGKAEALGHYETTLGDYRKLFDVIPALRSVTTEDIRRCAREYLVSEQSTTIVAERATDGADRDSDAGAGERGDPTS